MTFRAEEILLEFVEADRRFRRAGSLEEALAGACPRRRARALRSLDREPDEPREEAEADARLQCQPDGKGEAGRAQSDRGREGEAQGGEDETRGEETPKRAEEETMRRVVIESPYAGDVAENVTYARRCVLDCLRRGEAPYASHLFFTQPGLLDDGDPEERRLGIEAGLAWGRSADAVVVYVDRGVSRGMVQGIREARRRGTPVEIRSLDPAAVSAERLVGLSASLVEEVGA